MAIKFSVIIPTINQTHLVNTCVESLRKYEKNLEEYEVIVVDDGSDEKTQKWLTKWANENEVRLFLKKENSGFSHTVNLGLSKARGDVRILVNNDILFLAPLFEELNKSFKKDPQIGVVGAKLLFPNHTIQHAGVVRIPGTVNFVHLHKGKPRGQTSGSRYFIAVTGALFAIKRECYEKIGQLNQNYFLACEDVEYCLRVWNSGFRVFYNDQIEAIHIEGETRGNTESSKAKKGPLWAKKEKETIRRFVSDLSKFNLDKIEKSVQYANDLSMNLGLQEKKKIEIGCGYNPQPGYLHLDVRKLPHVEYVCDFSKEMLPFQNGEVDEILTNHVIEHISWRQLPFVLKEWNRVLRAGGRVFLRTPNLRFIAQMYLDGKITPEWPGDENYIRQHLSDQITPAWWANIKLFAGQDYPSNFHYLCFDFPMLKDLLERYGFERVRQLQVEPVFSPGELQVEAYKPMNKKARILVKRRGALGDVILTTPIVREIRARYGKESNITFATDCPVVYRDNPYVDQVVPGNAEPNGYDAFYDLDLAYERTPERHIIDSYSEVAFAEQIEDKRTILYPNEDDKRLIDEVMYRESLSGARLVVAHMAVTWKNRTWPRESWDIVVQALVEKNYSVVVVGTKNDLTIDRLGVLDLRGKLSIHQICELISRAKVFVGNDSGLLHVAGTTDTRIVGLFTSAKGEYRVPYRKDSESVILKPLVDCYGCLHKEKPPVTYCECRRGDYICLGQISPDQVVRAID